MSVTKLPGLADTFDLSESETASRFSGRHPILRWCQTWGCWLIWDGTRWKRDSTVRVYDLIRGFCTATSETLAEQKGDCRRVQSAAFIAAVEKIARSDRRHAAVPDQFDNDDWTLNTPGGLVDLKTGAMLEADPESYVTKLTGAAPKAGCDRWLDFLAEVTQYDVELVSYVQRVVGYCLTGSTREHALFFLYGTGGNGKSVFVETITGLLADYARTAPMEVFTESHGERHPTELAMLQGARLVVASETEAGRRWAQNKIKSLTGGDTVTARFMRQDYFEYKPKFKLLIAGNSKPKLKTVDEAMRRRFHIVPFTACIPAERRDPDLAMKLKAEWPGILQWAIEGCLKYQKLGLAPPEAVREATRLYLESQDLFAEWIDTECERGPDLWETPTQLFNSWRRFAAAAEEKTGTQSEFRERVESAGFHQAKDRNRGRYWSGLKVRKPDIRENSWSP